MVRVVAVEATALIEFSRGFSYQLQRSENARQHNIKDFIPIVKIKVLPFVAAKGGDSDARRLQRPSVTIRKRGAVAVLASAAIIDHVAVADVPSPGGAESP
jgi:hypothetical protein